MDGATAGFKYFELIDVIYVYEDGKVEVSFLHKDEFEAVTEFITRFI
jgi:hypothetical protein